MPSVGTASLDIVVDKQQLGRELTGAINSQGSTAAGLGKKFGALFAGGFAAVKTVDFFKDSIAEAREAAKVQAATNAVIKSTGGVAGVTADHIGKLSTKLSNMAGIDDELIQSGENVLATFTNIRNGVGKNNNVFDQATGVALDMSSALKTDLQGSIIQVGKALNDPIKGITALQRVGVSFTASQKEQIKTLVASGDTLGAQKLILKELKTEFGGAAKAAADPMQKLKVATDNLKESVGTALLPVLSKGATILGDLTTVFVNASAPVKVAIGVVAGLTAGIIAVNLASKAWTAATEAATAVQATFNAVLALNPVVLVVAAIAALGVAVFVAYQKFQPFHDAVDKAWQLLQSGFHWVQQNWPLLLGILTGPIGLAVLAISKNWSDLWGGMKGVVDGVWVGIQNAVRGGINGVIEAINVLIRAYNVLPFHKDIDTIPHLAMVSHDGPQAAVSSKKNASLFSVLPTFDQGGPVLGPIGKPQLAIVHGGEHVLTASQARAMQATPSPSGGAPGGVHVHVHNAVVGDKQQLALFLTETLTRFFNNGGAKPSWAYPGAAEVSRAFQARRDTRG